MPSTYSTDLRIELIANGEQSGTWGTTTNTNLGTLIEDAISGLVNVSVTSANQPLTALNGAADQARCAAISLSTTTGDNFAVYVPPVTKLYVIRNTSNIYIATVYVSTVLGNTTAAGTGIAIPAGATVLVRSDGTNIVEQLSYVAGSFSTGGSLTVDDTGTVGGSLTIGGDVTLRGAVETREPIVSYGGARFTATTPQTVVQASAINTTDDTINIASPLFTNGMPVMLSTSGTMPDGLSENTIYYVASVNRTRYYTAIGSISGNTLTITSIQAGAIGTDSTVTGTGVRAGTTVTAPISPVYGGGVGTYNLSGAAQTVASTRISGQFTSGAQLIKLSTNASGSSIVNINNTGTGNLTITPVVLANTPPADSTTTAVATTNYVSNAVSAANKFTSTNWTISETVATQTATMTIASPTVVTVASAPADGTAVSFSTTGALPTGITANAAYYVFNRNLSGTTYNLATTAGTAQTATITIASPAVITVASAPSNGDVVTFTTTGALPTGLTAGTDYYVINRTATTFRVATTPSGTAINTSGSQSGTHTATWRTLVNTSGSQSGTHTETTSTLYFKYKTINKMAVDLGGNFTVTGNVTAYGTL